MQLNVLSLRVLAAPGRVGLKILCSNFEHGRCLVLDSGSGVLTLWRGLWTAEASVLPTLYLLISAIQLDGLLQTFYNKKPYPDATCKFMLKVNVRSRWEKMVLPR